MARPFAVPFYHSMAWRRCREGYMSSVVDVGGEPCPPHMCERCFSRGMLVPADTVHHIRHIDPTNVGDPSVTLSWDNLMRVCRDCHAELHSDDPDGPEPRVSFDADGRVIPIGRDRRRA